MWSFNTLVLPYNESNFFIFYDNKERNLRVCQRYYVETAARLGAQF